MSSIITHNITEIYNSFKENTDKDEETLNFFNTFSYANVLEKHNIKLNSSNIFINNNNENTIKSSILSLLNKLHLKNITKTSIELREIKFKTIDDLNELVNQCIQKIKRDNDQLKQITAELCYELQSTYFLTDTNEKIYFRKILLAEIKNDYIKSINFNDNSWDKDFCEKTLNIISIFYNKKIINKEIIISIINDLKNKLVFKEDETPEYYNIIENIIYQFISLLLNIEIDEDNLILLNEHIEFLENELIKYDGKKYISKKIQLICKNKIDTIKKNSKL
jgi:hypothetical protein